MTLDTTGGSRFIAFLRAINVGGHNVKMDHLRGLFGALGFSNVETFIASGNVIFEAAEEDVPALIKRIEDYLQESLGYEVATFIRSPEEVAAIADYEPFPASELAGDGNTLYVVFLAAPLDGAARQAVMAFRNEVDDFHVHGCEIYWLSRKKVGQSKISTAHLEKTVGTPATRRNMRTVQRLGAKYAAR